MNEAHESALSLIRELHALDATEVEVGDVRVVFNRPQLVPMFQDQSPSDELASLRAEVEALRIFREQVEARGY